MSLMTELEAGQEREAAPGSTPQRASAGSFSDPIAPTYEGDFVLEGHLLLECGRTLLRPTLHYAVYGRLSPAADNAMLVCHALSGSALAAAWWPELFASGGLVDLDRDCVICVNLLGSCYGSTGPGSVDPESGEVFRATFPLVSVRDNVRAQAQLIDSLGIDKLRLAIGGSIGGMQALEWSILFPQRVAWAVVIAVAPLGAMGLALNHLQRRAIESDPDWQGGKYPLQRPPRQGLALARQIGMLSYKSQPLFDERFGRNPNRNGEDPWALDEHGGGLSANGLSGGRFDVAGFLDYQGQRFLERFDANAYLAITRLMDTWDPVRGFRDERDAFSRIAARITFVGISSDWLFPAQDIRRLAQSVRDAGVQAEYAEMVSDHGHDAFLAEQAELVRLLQLHD
jgi:homoserine O-acetyltransferase